MSNLNWEYIQNNPKITKRLLGIDYEQTIQLLELSKKFQTKKIKEIETEKTRLIKQGGGRPTFIISRKPNSSDPYIFEA